MKWREKSGLCPNWGTVHVNMALVVKFMANYLFNPGKFPEIPKRDDAANDDFLFCQGPTKGLGKIQFHDYNAAYDSVNLPNVNIFKEQIAVLKDLLLKAAPDKEQTKDIDFLLSLGELFTLVVYGQLVIEKTNMENTDKDLVNQIFDFMVRDFSKFALQIYSKPGTTVPQMDFCMKMIRRPQVNPACFQKIWQEYVRVLADSYEMNP
ncbi:MAG: hypothetical protein R2941_16935 [Desulfobacterales bacterium]